MKITVRIVKNANRDYIRGSHIWIMFFFFFLGVETFWLRKLIKILKPQLKFTIRIHYGMNTGKKLFKTNLNTKDYKQ